MSARISVYKETEPYPAFHNMWVGMCTCGDKWQFWFWGATVGYGLEHLWKGKHEHTQRVR